MTQFEAKNMLKLHLADYLLEEHGIDVSRSKKLFRCLTGRHEDNHPSMSYDHSRNKVRCFSCEEDLDIIDLIKIDKNLDTSSAFEYGYKRYNIDTGGFMKNDRTEWPTSDYKGIRNDIAPPAQETQQKGNTADYTAYYAKNLERLASYDYHTKRGLSEDICKTFNIGYDPNYKDPMTGQLWTALVIPTSQETYIARNINPGAESNQRYRKKGESRLFNLKALEQSQRPIFIVEGEIDALSIIECGGEAIGLGSTSNARKLLQTLEGRDTTENAFILLLDNDEAGQSTTQELAKGLEKLQAPYFRATLPDPYNDPNEILVNSREELQQFIESAPSTREDIEELKLKEEREEYEQTSAFNDLSDFMKGILNQSKYYPTGFSHLDYKLDGGLFPGLYFIGAISSLGKTTFALQIADQIAQRGEHVLIFSLEMDKKELIAKSISRITYYNDTDRNKRNAKSTRDVLTGSKYNDYNEQEIALIYNGIAQYANTAKNIYISVGVGSIGTEDIRKTVEKHVRVTGITPVVIIDYLQILAPFNIRYTDKQNTDKAVLDLKIISRDFHTPIIGVSSFNRDNYTNPVSMQSFKESGAIEYSSDVLIGLQYAGMEFQGGETEAKRRKRVRALVEAIKRDKEDGLPIPIELNILKNRNGVTGMSYFNFTPKFNVFDNVSIDDLVQIEYSLDEEAEGLDPIDPSSMKLVEVASEDYLKSIAKHNAKGYSPGMQRAIEEINKLSD